jgi:ATP-dependent DNA helicase 2 subunit 1
MQIRPGWSPRLVALLPQMERVDESGFTILPAGMNAIVLPWADDIRDPPTTVIESVGDAEVEVAKKIVDKLSLDSFDPAAFLNPSLQLFYNSIEALALERSEVSPFTDTITPDPNQFGRIATLFTEILTLIPDQTELPAEAPTKRKKTTDAPSSDLHDMYKIGKLSKATVAQLKAFLTGVGITPEKKKSDLLDQASDYFEKL